MKCSQELSGLIPQAIQRMRENTQHNPLQSGLAEYVDSLKSLSQAQRKELKTHILGQVKSESELSRRFLLRLLYDATDSVIEDRQLQYL